MKGKPAEIWLIESVTNDGKSQRPRQFYEYRAYRSEQDARNSCWEFDRPVKFREVRND